MRQEPEVLPKSFLTYAEAAQQLQVHVDTVRRWVQNGQLPAMRLSANLVRIRQDDLSAFLAGKRTPKELGR